MKKNLIRTAAIAAIAALGTVGAAYAASPNGVWKSSTGRHIQVSNCGGGLGMKIVKASNPAHVGKTIMCGAKPDGSNKWKGQLLNVDDGKNYTGIATLQSANSLKLEGCVLGGLICKADVWPRVQ